MTYEERKEKFLFVVRTRVPDAGNENETFPKDYRYGWILKRTPGSKTQWPYWYGLSDYVAFEVWPPDGSGGVWSAVACYDLMEGKWIR